MSVEKKSAAKAPARTRKSYSPAFHDEALKLAELKGVSGAVHVAATAGMNLAKAAAGKSRRSTREGTPALPDGYPKE